MRFVVDASVAVKLPVDEPGSDAARELAASGREPHAPRLMASEVADALWRKARLGQVERADAGAALAWLPGMPVRRNDDEVVSADAARLAPTLDHPVHVAQHIALAPPNGATVVTADRRVAHVLA